jgi:hypothetical protein
MTQQYENPQFHAWCEQDGRIVYDPQWKGGDSDRVKKTWELSDVPCYEPFDLMKQIECGKQAAGYIVSQHKTNKKKNSPEIWHLMFPEGLEGYCWLNAICYKKFVNPKAKIVFGKAGWIRKRDGEPHYEYGDGTASVEDRKWLMKKMNGGRASGNIHGHYYDTNICC